APKEEVAAKDVATPEKTTPAGPNANNDNFKVKAGSGPTSVPVTDNDKGNITALMVQSMPAHGNVHQTDLKTLQYTPDPGFVGTDLFTYQAKDANQVASTIPKVLITVTSPSSSCVPSQAP